jgi:hypothetical protein
MIVWPGSASNPSISPETLLDTSRNAQFRSDLRRMRPGSLLDRLVKWEQPFACSRDRTAAEQCQTYKHHRFSWPNLSDAIDDPPCLHDLCDGFTIR